MPTTPVLALPYPSASDTADVPRDIQALASKLDGYSSLRPPLVTALPGSPVDGQEVYYQSAAMAANGELWHLRYRAAAPGTFKWELVGGNDLATVGAGNITIATGVANWADPTTPGPDIVAPLAGDYRGVIACSGNRTDTQQSVVGVGIALGAGATPSADAQMTSGAVVNGIPAQMGGPIVLPAVTAGMTLRMRYLGAAGGPVVYSSRRFTVRPVRVG